MRFKKRKPIERFCDTPPKPEEINLTIKTLSVKNLNVGNLNFPASKASLRFDYKVGRPILKKGSTNMLTVATKTTEKILITLAPINTTSGKPAKVDGAPVWTVSSGAATLEVAADGLSSQLISEDVEGKSIISITADADLGEGVVEILDTVEYDYTEDGGVADNLGLTAGAITPKA